MRRLAFDPQAAIVDVLQSTLRRLVSSSTPVSPLLDIACYPHLRDLEVHADSIRDEAEQLIARLGGARNARDLNPLSVGVTGAWRLIPLVDRRGPMPYVTSMPTTRRALTGVPGLRAADLAQLDAGSTIHPHRGHNVGVVRAHLTLVEPTGTEPCRLEFPDLGVVKTWRSGQVFVFDDLVEHRAVNERTADRLVLHIEIDRPGGLVFRTVNTIAQVAYRFHPIQRGVRARALDAYRDR